MKRNFTNENFEDFLRQSSDDLRMQPSGKVWKGISNQLNQRRRRVGFAIGTFLLALSTFAYLAVQNTSRKFAESTSTNKAKAAIKPAANETFQNITGNATFGNDGNKINHVLKNSPVTKANHTSLFAANNFIIKEIPREENYTTQQDASSFVPTIVDSYFESTTEEKTNFQTPALEKRLTYPLTIESVVNSYKPSKKKKLSFQFYFTPTTSYRKLSENKSFLLSQSPTNPSYAPALIFDVNNVVTHRPDLGFEMGMAAKYFLTRKMKLLGGLQFNVNRYNIKAYNAVTSVATIMFNGRRNNLDSLNAITTLSNTNGYKTDWLQNYYIQISAPVGVELKLAGNDKVQFGLSTTIQPTYVLGDRAYLISTDYKSYAEVPQLVRRWNVNTALSTFVGYSTGRLGWQVGPQVRYQLLSSFIDKYPVKENLFDFGLKVGISINK